VCGGQIVAFTAMSGGGGSGGGLAAARNQSSICRRRRAVIRAPTPLNSSRESGRPRDTIDDTPDSRLLPQP